MTDNGKKSRKLPGPSDKENKLGNDMVINDSILAHLSKLSLENKNQIEFNNQPTDSTHHSQADNESLDDNDSNDSDEERRKNSELFTAVGQGKLEKIRELLKAGVKIDITDKNNKGNTLVHYAVERKKEEVIKELLKWKADVNAKNSKGDTSLDIAKRIELKSIVEILESHSTKSLQTSVEVQSSQQQTIRSEEHQNEEKKQPSSNKAKGIVADEGELKIPCERRKGTASSGDSYEVDLLILGKIRAEKNTDRFYLDVNVNGLGAFDDIVFKYWKKGKPAIILLQAKHVEDRAKNKVTIEKFTNPKNEKFYLGKYFLDFLKIRGMFNDKHENPIFRGNLKELVCKYIIYTNSVVHEKFDKNRITEVGDCILSASSKNEKGKSFKFSLNDANSDVISMLENVSCQEKVKLLAEAVVNCISGKLDYTNMMGNELLKTYHVFLAKNLIEVTEKIEKNEKNIKFREGKINFNLLSTSGDDIFKKTFEEEILYKYAKNKISNKNPFPELGDKDKRNDLVIRLAQSLKQTGKVDEDVMKKLGGSVIIIDTKGRQFKFADEDKIKDGNIKQFIVDLKGIIPNLAEYDAAIYEFVKRKAEKEQIKLHFCFGNINPTFKKPQHFIDVLIKLFKEYESQKIIKINDDDKKGLTEGDIKNIGQLVGNLLVFDEKDKMLKFTSKESLLKFFQDLNCEVDKLNSLDVDSYRLDIKVKNFPRVILVEDKDRVNVKEFLNKLEVFTGQASDPELKGIIKDEIRDFYKLNEEEIEDNFLKIKNKAEEHRRNGKYYLRKDCYDHFFSQIVKQNIKFDVKGPLISFSGREQQLKDLHTKIQSGSKVIICSISGLGGIGKTELARKYIHEFGNYYDNNIIWINAENEGTLNESFIRLAKDKLEIKTKDANKQEKDIKCIVGEVYDFFTKRKSLFVFDNAEVDEKFKNFLPRNLSNNKSYILITSRIAREEWESWGVKEGITLDVFTEEEAISFVKKALQMDKKEEPQDDTIKKLSVDTLHRFPLALQQAVAYIKVENAKFERRGNGKYTIDNYLEDYTQKMKKLLDSRAFKNYDNDYDKTTATTWKVTTDKIKNSTEYGQLALEILDVIAYFAPNNIPVEKLFSKLEKDNSKLWEAVDLLHRYSMIKLQQGKIDIHRLVQKITQLELNEQGKEEEILRTDLNLFTNAIDASNLDHAVSTWDHARKYEDLVQDFGALPTRIMHKLVIRGEYKKALSLSNLFVKTFESFDLKKNVNYFLLMNKIGFTKILLGKCPEALSIFENILNSDTVDYFTMLDVLQNKGLALAYLNQNEKALEILNITFEEKRRKLGEKNISTLTVQLVVVQCLYNLRKYDEALKTAKFVYNIMKKEHPDHVNTWIALYSIGCIHSSMNHLEKAKKVYDEVYKTRKEILDCKVFDLLLLPHLGISLAEQGKHKEALEVNDDSIKAQEETALGGDHQKILRTKSNKAWNLIELGRIDEAVDLLKEVIGKQENLLPDSLIEMLLTKDILAYAYLCDGKYKQAINLWKEIYAARETDGRNLDFPKILNDIKFAKFLLCGGHTRLHAAVLKSNEELVRALLKKGDDVNARNKKNRTPLHLASAKGNPNIVVLLLEKGANFEARASGCKPLHYATHSSKQTVVKILRKTSALFSDVKKKNICQIEKDIDEGAIIHATDDDSWTVLHYAVQRGYLKIVELLLDRGADPKKKDRDGKTPLDLAKENITRNPRNPTNNCYKQILVLLETVSGK